MKLSYLRIMLSDARKADAANSFARSGIIRIADLYAAEVAEGLHNYLDTQAPWTPTVSQGERAFDLSPGA